MDEIRALGAELVAVSPQKEERLEKLIKRHNLTFVLLRDEANAFAETMGLRIELPEELRRVYLDFKIDLPDANGEPSWTLPMPARYIVDQTATIRYARVHPDYTHRPEPKETLEALRRIETDQ